MCYAENYLCELLLTITGQWMANKKYFRYWHCSILLYMHYYILYWMYLAGWGAI